MIEHPNLTEPVDASVAPLSGGRTDGDAGLPIPEPGPSRAGARPMRKRERAGIIVLLTILGYLVVVVYDRLVRIPDR